MRAEWRTDGTRLQLSQEHKVRLLVKSSFYAFLPGSAIAPACLPDELFTHVDRQFLIFIKW